MHVDQHSLRTRATLRDENRGRLRPRRIRVRLGAGAVVGLVIIVFAITTIITLAGKSGSTAAVDVASVSAGSVPAGAAPAGAGPAEAVPQGAVSTGPKSEPSAGPSETTTRTSAGGTAGSRVVVHVLGGVTSPGLYTLPSGSRVDDAIRAAGGTTGDADQSANNLARVLSDGEQIYVPAIGETPPTLDRAAGGRAPGDRASGDRAPDGGAPQGGSSSSASGSTANGVGEKVNINRADSEELQSLPRIGPVTANNIITYRRDNGDFASVDDLVLVSGIGPKTIEAVRERATV